MHLKRKSQKKLKRKNSKKNGKHSFTDFYYLFSQIFRRSLHWSRRYFGEAAESPRVA
jgi:hypothetical protein